MRKTILYMFGVLLFNLSCSPKYSLTQKAPFPVFDTEGHRGARGLMPENTIPGMYLAIDLDVTTLEMDVHVSKDNKIVLSHDSYFNSAFVLDPFGNSLPKGKDKGHFLYQMNYDSIKKYDVGSKDYPRFPEQRKIKTYKPTLDAVIDSVQAYLKVNKKPQVFYNIETKGNPLSDNVEHPEPETFVRLLMDVINKKKITPWVIIQSSDVRTLQVLHEKYPHVRTSLLVSRGTVADNLDKLGFVPDIYSPYYVRVTPKIIQDCKEKNMKVVVWTINTKAEIEKFKKMGVDGIISDHPNLFKE